MAKKHGNSNQNDAEHHLYEIRDRRVNDVFKYGISGRPLKNDGSSPRANEQITLFNRVAGWVRFFAKILLTGIAGRAKAKRIENEYIDSYESENGKRPPGNPK